jgi:hypothetical protein
MLLGAQIQRCTYNRQHVGMLYLNYICENFRYVLRDDDTLYCRLLKTQHGYKCVRHTKVRVKGLC